MIQAYSGEFTVSPIPLEMSMNYCSHKCAYCFANLNQPGRTLDVQKSINKIKNCHKSRSLSSYLLSNGYLVLISNRVDPFAATNWRQSLSFIELLCQNGNDIAIQTKGGQGVTEALQILNPSNWYISISFLNDEMRKKIEPGAPSINERLKLIETLLSKGHSVCVGINPLVEEWLPYQDFEDLTDKLIELGVSDFWIETLHLNRKQVSRMSEKEINNISSEVIDNACKRNRNSSYFMMCYNYLREKESPSGEPVSLFSINQPYESKFFDKYHSIYKDKTLPTHQDFINHLFEKYPSGAEIKFNEYYQFMKKDFYESEFSEADGYAYRIARNVYRKEVETPLKTLREVLAFYWDNDGVSKSLSGNALFSVVCYEEDNKLLPYACHEDGLNILYFHAYPKNVYTTVIN